MTASPVIVSATITATISGDHLILSGTGANGSGWTVGIFEANANGPINISSDKIGNTFDSNGVGNVKIVNGAWSIDLGPASAFAGKEFGAAAFNNGNPNTESKLSNIVSLDTTPPVVTAALSDDTGSSHTDGLTHDASLSGTAEANSTVSISIDGGTAVTVTTDGSGNWSFAPSLADGAHSVSVSQTDAAGNTGATSTDFTLDTTPPAVTAGLSNDTGTSSSDGITNDASLSGTAEANSTVSISIDGGAAVSVTTDGNGNWSFAPSLADGAHSVSVSQTDAAGNTGTASTSFTLDTTAPAVTAGLAHDSGSSSSDGITNDASLSGTAEANSTVSISIDGGTAVTVTTDGSGNWSFAPSLADGAHSVSVSQTDAAGNTGTTSTDFTLDTTPPAVTAGLSNDTGTSGSDGITNDASLSGTAEANSTVSISIDGGTAVTVTTDGSGNWSFAPSLADGAHSVSVSQTDAAGNTGATSTDFTLDTTPPAVTAGLSNDTGTSSSDGITNDASLSGTAEANSTVSISIDGGAAVSVTTDGNGNWSFAPSLADGAHSVSVSQTDAAGNTGATSTDFTLDTTAPVVTAALAHDTGASSSDGVTNNDALAGTAEANSTVSISVDNGAAVTVTTDGNGNWHYTPTLTDGAHSVSVSQTDTAGNTAATTTSFTLDTVAPPVTVALAHDSGVSSTDHITNNDALFGFGDPNATVTLMEGTTVIGTTTADGNGAWAFTPSGLHDGAHTIVVSETDLAGNTGSASVTFTQDTTADFKPVINTIDQGAGLAHVQYWSSATPTTAVIDGYSGTGSFTIEGTGVKGSSVTLWDSNHSSVFNTSAIIVDATGHWSYKVSGLSQGEHGFQAVQTDVAGNQSPISNKFDVVVDSTGPVVAIANATATTSKGSTVYTLSGSYSDNLTMPGSIKISVDGGTPVAATVTNSSVNGAWAFSTTGLSNAVHSFTVQGTDLAGNQSAQSAAWILGTAGNDTLTFGNGSLPVNGTITGGGGNDKFSFTGSFGADKISDFTTGDTLQFSTAEFANLTALLNHAHQVGGDVVITLDAHDTVTLMNTKLAALTTNNVHFA